MGRKRPGRSCQTPHSYLGYEEQVPCSDLKISFSYAYSKRLKNVVVTSQLKRRSLALPGVLRGPRTHSLLAGSPAELEQRSSVFVSAASRLDEQFINQEKQNLSFNTLAIAVRPGEQAKKPRRVV